MPRSGLRIGKIGCVLRGTSDRGRSVNSLRGPAAGRFQAAPVAGRRPDREPGGRLGAAALQGAGAGRAWAMGTEVGFSSGEADRHSRISAPLLLVALPADQQLALIICHRTRPSLSVCSCPCTSARTRTGPDPLTERQAVTSAGRCLGVGSRRPAPRVCRVTLCPRERTTRPASCTLQTGAQEVASSNLAGPTSTDHAARVLPRPRAVREEPFRNGRAALGVER